MEARSQGPEGGTNAKVTALTVGSPKSPAIMEFAFPAPQSVSSDGLEVGRRQPLRAHPQPPQKWNNKIRQGV